MKALYCSNGIFTHNILEEHNQLKVKKVLPSSFSMIIQIFVLTTKYKHISGWKIIPPTTLAGSFRSRYFGQLETLSRKKADS